MFPIIPQYGPNSAIKLRKKTSLRQFIPAFPVDAPARPI
jgi:hypothetical protein